MCAIPNNSESDENPDSEPPTADGVHQESSHEQASVGEEVPAAAGAEPTVEQQLVAALAERDASHDRWLRCRAEVENVQKRAHREMLESRRFQVLPLSVLRRS